MPSKTQVTAALSLIEHDRTKVLGLTVGNYQNIQPGQYIPRAGESFIGILPSDPSLGNQLTNPPQTLRRLRRSLSPAHPRPRPTWS